MYNNITYILFIVYFFQIIYTYNINETILYTYNNITTYDAKEEYIYIYKYSISKERVLNIKNDQFYTSYYCKNDNCISVDNKYRKPFIEFPDENGNIKLYITTTLSNNTVKSYNNFPAQSILNNNVYISDNCTNDSQCLSNKCIDNCCIFNDKVPIVHCDNIYLGYRKSYMYCGKAYLDNCTIDEECSSQICYNETCRMQLHGPSDSDTMPTDTFIYCYYSSLLIIIILIIICCCCCRRRIKKLNNNKLIE